MKTETLESLKQKLAPRRFTSMSGKMAAIVGCILGASYASPSIAQLTVTSDGYVLARNNGHIGYDDFIGAESELNQNWQTLLQVAELTPEELNLANQLFQETVTHV